MGARWPSAAKWSGAPPVLVSPGAVMGCAMFGGVVSRGELRGRGAPPESSGVVRWELNPFGER